MRSLLPFVLLAACSPEAAPPAPAKTTLYAGEGRDRLCVKGARIGFIAFGQGDANCSAKGRIDRTGEHSFSIVPDGDQDCRIAVQDQGDTLRLGKVAAACAYYCGPGATFEGKAFTRNAAASLAVDFAGDPLC